MIAAQSYELMLLDSGSRLGSYQILSALGTGGMGIVYLARDTKLTRNVAIKVLHAENGTGGEADRRLIREARAAARLDHPNICTIYEVGESDGRAFIVMQLIEGETLETRLRRGPIGVADAIALGAEIADALGEAHAQGIVHRDIKPANIMITRKGQAKVMDFGVAAFTHDPTNTSQTRTATALVDSAVIGSLPYMSPEQLAAGPVDGRSDVFSLGGLLYEAVTGHHPFGGTSAAATISAILTSVPRPLSEHRVGVSDGFERILQKALAKSPDERYQSVRDFAVDLRRLLKDPHARTADAHRRVGRARLIALAGAALALAAGAGLSVHWLNGRGAPIRSLAVMPFANTAGDREMDYLADGITDEIIDRLSQLPDLKVMSHSAVFHYKGKDPNPVTAGRELGVNSVLVGRLTARPKAIAIQLELVSVDDGSHLWGAQYDRPLSEIVTLPREIPVDISARLRLRLQPESATRLARPSTTNAEAYQLYLKGRIAWEKWTPEGAKEAIDFFERAITVDPNYALAYAGIADAYMIGAGGTLPEAYRHGREAATKALSLDSNIGEAHAALAGVLIYVDWNFAEAEQEYQRAIVLNPNCAECYHEYSHLLLLLGRLDDSLRQSRKFLELDPVSHTPIEHLGYHYLRARRFADAITQYLEDRRLYPDAGDQAGELADAYYFSGMYREAVDEYVKQGRAQGATAGELTSLTDAFSHAGIVGYLRRQIEQWTSAPQTEATRFATARYSARLGDRGRTFELLEKLCAEHSWAVLFLKEDPSFDPVRTDPRFSDLLRRVGLPQ
jgi:TolB-like protein/Flp pilus assembly protein TadD/predicted Ser/Thr protein kinase